MEVPVAVAFTPTHEPVVPTSISTKAKHQNGKTVPPELAKISE
jgi:hypothetical protein